MFFIIIFGKVIMTKNIHYKEFKKTGLIKYITIDHLKKALENIEKTTKKNEQEEAKALLITLYYTGCRPAEALLMKSKQIEKKGTHLKLLFVTLKGGRARTIWLSTKKFPLLRILYEWHLKKYHEEYLFFNFMGKYKHKREWFHKRENKLVNKEYIDLSAKLPYYFKKWFKGIVEINPYYLRHNKFSKLANDPQVTDRDLMQLKGARSYDSIEFYIHQSAQRAKKLSTKGG